MPGGDVIRSSADPKIFGIGLSRTGTTSLTGALRLLGYQSVHYPPLDRLDDVLRSHAAATDTSVACCYQELDGRYPGSRFILTVRDPDDWSSSAARFFACKPVTEPWQAEVRRRVYGSLEWDDRAWPGAYLSHNDGVLEYFAHRTGDLLVMDICGGAGWTELCGFLGQAEPRLPFPHAHRFARTHALPRRDPS